MTPLGELVASIPPLAFAGVLVIAVALAVWPGAVLAARWERRDSRPTGRGHVSYRPGRVHIGDDATLIDAFAGIRW